MSFNDNDERIEQLEKNIRDIMGLIGTQTEVNRQLNDQLVMLAKGVIALKEQQDVFIKFVASSSTLGSQAERDSFLAEHEQRMKNWDEKALPFLRLTLLPSLPPPTPPR